MTAAVAVATRRWRGEFADGERVVPDEVPIAFSFNRVSHAVMLATPQDLEDFAIGFSRSEGIIGDPAEIEDLEIIHAPNGIECRMWIGPALLDRLDSRRRLLAGPTGCGLCGLDSLAAATRTPPHVGAGGCVAATDVQAAMAAMPAWQALGAETRAVHAAGFWQPGEGMVAAREDVGRHNALDKLLGALARAGVDPSGGLLLLTSRVSVELVQKAAVAGATIMVAVSAPTKLALDVADAAGLTLVGVARRDGFEVFTHAHRIEETAPAEGALLPTGGLR